jgi:hypothetical protein
MPQHSMLWFALARDPALALDRDLARDLARALTGERARDRALTRVLALDRARARDLDELDELRRTQFGLRDFLINYLKKWLPGVRSRSLPDVQSLINCLQLLNDRLEGKAQPVEAIALVRRERARK